MKRIVKLLLLILLLIPVSVKAAATPQLDNKFNNISVEIPYSDLGAYVENGVISPNISLYQVKNSDGLYFQTYRLKDSVNYSSELTSSTESSKELTEEQKKLLNLLLSNVNQINKTNTENIENASLVEKINMVVTQILVYEIVGGERNSFTNIETNSKYYKNVISINKNSSISSGTPSLYDTYVNIIRLVNESGSNKSTNSQQNPYKLYYNAEKNRYQNVITSIDYDTLKSNYEITNNTPIKLSSTSSGMLSYISNKDYFNDVKAIALSQKIGSTNKDLEEFYFFNGNDDESYVLATKADKVPTKMYFTCAQGNFKILSLEGSGLTILGATYNIKDKDGNTLKFVNNASNEFTYTKDSNDAITDIVINTSNTYIISDLPDGEYSVIQTKVPKGNSFSVSEDNRTVKVKITNGKFYSYNKVMKKYELNAMHLIKFTNYASKVYVVDASSQDKVYNIIDSNNTVLDFDYNSDSGIYKPIEGRTSPELTINAKKNNITIYSLDAGDYTIKNTVTNETRKFKIKNDGLVGDSVLVSFDNKINEISFYKLDDEGNYLNGGEFSIREIDPSNEEKYVDLSLKKLANNTYEINENGGEFTFPVTNGKVIIKNASKDKYYRIIELSPPDGYQLYDANSSVVNIEMDSEGYTKGTPYLINKKIIISNDASSNAEIILSIRTGNNIVKYGLIALIIASVLAVAILIRKKAIK